MGLRRVADGWLEPDEHADWQLALKHRLVAEDRDAYVLDPAGVDAVTAARVGRVAIEVGAAVLDLLLQDEATDDAAWVSEAKAAICNYLAPYFEDSAPL